MAKIIFIPYKYIERSVDTVKENISSPLKTDLSHVKNPVIFICNGIGDGFLALPTIRALAKCYSNKLTVLYDACALPSWLYDLPLKQLILIEVMRNATLVNFDYLTVAKSIRNCDLFISLNYYPSLDTKKLLSRVNPKLTVGFDYGYDIHLQQSKDKHASEVFFEALSLSRVSKQFDIKNFCYPIEPLVTLDKKSKDMLITLVKKNTIVLGIHTDTQPSKMWTGSQWDEFLFLFIEAYPNSIILIFGNGYEFQLHNNHMVDLTRISIELAIAFVKQCHAFVSIDSCFLHIADFLGLIGVGLFLDSDPTMYGYRYSSVFSNLSIDQNGHITPKSALMALSANLRKRDFFQDKVVSMDSY